MSVTEECEKHELIGCSICNPTVHKTARQWDRQQSLRLDISDDALAGWLSEYKAGSRSRSEIERDDLGDLTSNGHRITFLWAERLGVDLAGRAPMTIENERLRARIKELEAALAAK